MKNGYYLSIYSNISPIASLLGVGVRDNQNMSLWKVEDKEVMLVHYWEFERISGYKQHKYSFYSIEHAKKVINSLLERYQLTIDDMTGVFGTPGLSTISDYATMEEFPEHSYHSLSHLFSCLYMDTDKTDAENIIAIAADGGPDNVVDTMGRSKYFYSAIVSKKGSMEAYPVESPGAVWVFMKHRYNMQEGSLMALGSAATVEASLTAEECFEQKPHMFKFVDININYQWFENVCEQIEKLTQSDEGSKLHNWDSRFTEQENIISMAVKIFQKISKMIMVNDVEMLLKESGLRPEESYLALAGGYALNCPTNTYLMEKYHFKGFIAPPCVSDTGLSLGMALYYFNKQGRKKFKFASAFYGDSENEESIRNVLEGSEFSRFIKESHKADVKEIAADIIEQPIVWFAQGAEVGPRALGARSIFADPRNEKHKDRLNEVKQRQWWRPVAPIILEEYTSDYFETDYKSPYMLMAVKMKEDKREKVPAVLHLDNTARIQTVNESDNKMVYEIVKEFYNETNVPMICNTSLNDKGEPIIDNLAQALNFALRKQIPVVYADGIRIELQNMSEYQEDKPEKRSSMFDCPFDEEKKKQLLQEYNPFGLSRQQLITYLNNPELSAYCLTDEKQVKKLKRLFKHMASMPF